MPDIDYTMQCIGCTTDQQLRMIPQELNNKIVGWLFFCPKCLKDLDSKKDASVRSYLIKRCK
jgi:hypothetical protein